MIVKMTDAAMFYPMFKILQDNEVYYPKINNADIYLDFITENYGNNELENAYQDFTKIFDIESFEWMYYYVYIILLNDFESINKELYKKIMDDMIIIYQTEYKNDETNNMRGFSYTNDGDNMRGFSYTNDGDNRRGFSYTNDGGIHIGWSHLRADDPKLKTSLGRL